MDPSVDRRGSSEGRIKSHKSFKINAVEENQMSQQETKFMAVEERNLLCSWGEQRSVSDYRPSRGGYRRHGAITTRSCLYTLYMKKCKKICTSSAKSPHSVAGTYVIWHILRCELGDEPYVQSTH